MKPECPNLACSSPENPPSGDPTPRPLVRKGVIRKGYFRRSSDSKFIRRFLCRDCGRHFSRATFNSCFGQKRRRLNPLVRKLYYSGVSLNQMARILKVNRKTVVRKFRFIAAQARLEQLEYLERYRNKPISFIQFDDLETSEHSKCKPLSVTLAVEPKSRNILDFRISQMPAKGPLAAIALRKYGYREDKRPEGWDSLMQGLKPLVSPDARFLSDQNPHYPRFVQRHFPKAIHATVPGKRGCVAGQGELKKIAYDPLFSLNHTCAMLRAHLNRLFRRTWCTTKNRDRLADHIALYVSYHNWERTAAGAG